MPTSAIASPHLLAKLSEINLCKPKSPSSRKKEIRKTLHENEWWFVIADIIAALTDSVNPSGYLKDMRRREPALAEAFKRGANCHPPLA